MPRKPATRPAWELTRPFWTFFMLRKIGYFLPSHPNGGPCPRVTSDSTPVLVFLMEMLLRTMIICVMVGLISPVGWQTFITAKQVLIGIIVISNQIDFQSVFFSAATESVFSSTLKAVRVRKSKSVFTIFFFVLRFCFFFLVGLHCLFCCLVEKVNNRKTNSRLWNNERVKWSELQKSKRINVWIKQSYGGCTLIDSSTDEYFFSSLKERAHLPSCRK